MADAVSFYGGKDTGTDTLHEAFYEHLLASEYGWDLEYIRNLSIKKFTEHVLICTIKAKILQKHAEAIMGVGAIRSMG